MKVYLIIVAVVLSGIGFLVTVLFGSRVLRTLIEWSREGRKHGSGRNALEGGTTDV